MYILLYLLLLSLQTSAILANDADQNGMEPLTFEATTVGFPFPAFSLSSDGSLLTTTTAIDRLMFREFVW